ncbi:MAG: BamA/TamA family outer membrane protein [Balneolaceae bacterium]
MTSICVRLFIAFFISFLCLTLTYQQVAAQDTEEQITEETDKVVRIVRFSGNDDIANGTLKGLVRTQNNREFLGIPRFTPWYFIHQAIGVGEAPSYLNRELVATDIDRIRTYYQNLGYFEATVDTSIIEFRTNRVEVSFIIEEGPRSRIRSVAYQGWPDFEDEQMMLDFYGASEIGSDMENDSTFSVDRFYRVSDLRTEQTRIVNFLKNNGYASVQRDSVLALVKPIAEEEHSYDVLFSINPGGFYTFGDVHIKLAGPDADTYDEYEESLQITDEENTMPGYSINMEKQESAQTRFSLLSDQIVFKPGEPFDQSAYIRSVNAFQNLGIFLTNRFGLNEEVNSPDFSQPDIPVFIELQSIPKHSISAELFGMRRYGFGTGFGVNYNNNNLRGRADNLALGVNTSFEYVPSGTINEISPDEQETGTRTRSGATFFQSYEVSAEYTVPRLNFPFQAFQNRSWVQNSSTRYALTYSQSDQLFFRINSDIRFNLGYEVTHSPKLTSLIDLIEVDIIDTDPSAQFRQNLIDEFGEQSIEFQRIEEDFRPQVSSIIRYTIRNRDVDLITRADGFSTELSAAIGGNIPYFLDRYVSTPGTIEQALPPPFNLSSNELQYSRFIKFSADFRRYLELTPSLVLALRSFTGYSQPIFDSQSIPLNRRFFAGGSNDIRGWAPFDLGPGGIGGNIAVPGGEIKLAAFKEFRQVVLRDFLGSNWQVAWHTDAGNIWYGQRSSLLDGADEELLDEGRFYFNEFYNQIAVGSGIGLRFDFEFLVIRFDTTYRIHDLERGWFNNSNPRFSFGIGHSF